MDPAEAAAAYLTSVFERMGVPCRVSNTPEKGKHVVATADIPAQSDLFEEAPIVSWPAQSYVEIGIPFCSHCLRQQRKIDATRGSRGRGTWSTCNGCGSFFCSDICESSSRTAHRILCCVLKELREEKVNANLCTDSVDDTRYKPITKESLARCVAWIVSRIATSIQQQKFSGKVLGEHHNENGESIARQLFHIATAPFNRLIDVPRGTEFADVDAAAWYRTVDELLREPCRAALLGAAAQPSADGDVWAEEIVDALLRHDTLESLLGQMTLNAQALNSFLLFSPSSGGAPSSATPPAEWVLKGGGVYTLQSAFNHSCRPNVIVSAMDGTHDITLRTLRPVKNGEELTITYIPLKDTTREKRHALLRGYFFTCHCPLCKEEETATDASNA
ncbi:hypothetical protein DQ04_04581020 [Trypanosoma grayi]|uniref:hypothetical protein n=1 Tax=Trypanosoma grayi TaxID=71804 RepID=UPI0004F469EF|nr:hypothetical protein DQ04_04581020 [Trypanosoma grayi]KEG09820.1 hypothetical protein DQ04_04581020 [Trypanosoma grayi]